jgi:hypothetical protein
MRWSGGMWHKLKILITDFSFLGFSPVFVHHFFTEDFISLLVYGRFHFFIIVRNLPFLYCTEYSVVCLDCGIFISVSFIYKRETNPHVNKIIKNKNTFAFAYPVDLSTPPCSTNTDQCSTDQETVIREGAFLILVCGITLPVENLFIKHWFVVSRFR